MNKIIIVGHPHSGHEEVQRLLTECGMAPALPSRREGLTPTQITQTLLKAHGAVPVEQLQTAQQIQQIKVAPVWQGMVLDLMFTNLDQTLWGWADTEAVYLLDYWREQDPQVVFVLVYDAPETVFTRAPLDQAAASPEELQRRIDAWVAYNVALLHFHLRNPGRSVLVHAGQVQASAKSSLHHISTHINAPLQLPPSLLTSAAAPGHAPQNTTAKAETVESLTAKLQAMQGSQFKKARRRLRAQLLALQILQDTTTAVTEGGPVVQHSSESVPVPDLPLSLAPNPYEQQSPLDADALAHLLARQLLQAHPQAIQLYEELQAAATLAHGMDAQPDVPALQMQGSLATYQAWQALVQQCLHLQEQTRRIRAQAAQIKLLQQQMEQASSLTQKKALRLEELQTLLVNAQENHQQQTQKIAQTLAQKQAAEEEGRLLLEQLHKVQEELENHYLQVQQQEKALAELPKVKADLKAVQGKVQQLQQSEEQLKKQLQAERTKAPAADLQEENKLLLTQLHKVQEELERYYQENSRLKETQKSQPKAYYGAADRVKRQLSYRLGATMIAQSRSVGGWLRMPFALHAEAKRFKKDQVARQSQKLPPIKQYRDAHEAERIKQHLSYRLGACMLANSKSLGGWVSMPWALFDEVKAFRKMRQ